MSKISVNRPVTTVMLILIILAFGFLSLANLNLDMMPNMNIPVAVVSTTYKGAGPEEIEKLVTKPIEGILGTVSSMKSIQSVSSNEQSLVVVQFEDGTNIDIVTLDMREKLDMIKRVLPANAENPVVVKINMNEMASINIGVSSDKYDLVELKRITEDRITNRLAKQDGVASVNVTGGLEKEISIVFNEERLRGYGLSETTISQLLMAENRNTPVGTIKQGERSLNLRTTGEFQSIEEIRNMPIISSTGTVIYLRDVATVTEDFKETNSLSYINGKPSISLTVQKQSTANTIKVSDKVLKELTKLQKDLPDITLKMLIDPAEFVRFTLSTVVNSAVQGGLLAVIILFIFLRNFRATLIVAAAMPISIIATFVLMYYTNVTINVMSLGGLTLGIGMLVDNSIVVLESVYRKIEEGANSMTAAIEGASEVGMAVTASTLTTVAVFLPITFGGGLTSEIFSQLAMTIAFSLLSSLLVSLTFVPMACSLLFKFGSIEHKHKNIITAALDFIGFLIDKLIAGYKALLTAALKHKLITAGLTIVILVLTMSCISKIGQEFMPATDESGVVISISLPRGSLLEETERVTNIAIDKIKDYKEIVDVYWTVGGGGGFFGSKSTDQARINVQLVDKTERDRSSMQIAADMSTVLKSVAGAKITVSQMQSSMGNYAGGDDVTVVLKGDDLAMLYEMATDFKNLIAQVPGTRDAKTSVEDASPVATIRINRDKAGAYGITGYAVSSVISTAVSGTVATTYKINGDEFDVRIRQDKAHFDYIGDIKNILIPSPMGGNIPLYEMADVEIKDMPISISREDNLNVVTVTCKLDNRDLQSVSNDIRAVLSKYQLRSNFSWSLGGSTEQMEEIFGSLALALLASIGIVYMIMAAQFESLVYPFIVMFSIPIAMTGGMFGLFVMNTNLSITAYLGLIMLAGVVINNAIVLVDYMNFLIREKHMPVFEAVRTAGAVRLRPILMSTLTTVIALVPMMSAVTQGSELMKGLAIVVVFGLSLATLVTLVLIPVIYLFVNNVKNFIFKKRERGVIRG